MKATVIIKPYTDNDQMLPGIYHTPDQKVRILISNTQYKEMTAYEYEKEKPAVIDLNFSKKSMPTKEYKYETEESLQTPEDRDIVALTTIFWAEHPQFTVNGIANAKYTKIMAFDLINTADANIVKHKMWLNKLGVANRIHEMAVQGKRDVAYFFGKNPVGKTDIELDMMLADFNHGTCMLEVPVSGATKSNLDLFNNVWMKEDSGERSYIVNTRKAIVLGVFTNNPADGRDNYYYGQTFVGTAFNDVLAYCKTNERIYTQNIIREIASREERLDAQISPSKARQYPVAPSEATPVSEKQPAPPAMDAEAKKELDKKVTKARDEIRELVRDGHVEPVKGMHLMSLEKLQEIVEKGNKKKATATTA